MSMKTKICSMAMNRTMIGLAAAVLLIGNASAADIWYVGVNTNIDSSADDGTTVGWHSSGNAKSLDLDGDNVLGTDGWIYCVAGNNGLNNPARSLPSYFTDSNGVGWDVLTSNFSEVPDGIFTDYPTPVTGPNPPQAQTEAWWGWAVNVKDMFQFTFNTNATELASKTLRVGLLFGINPRASVTSPFEQTFSITQTVGGSTNAVSPALYNNLTDLNAAFFDLENVSEGDTFVINANTYGSGGFPTLVGVTFDDAAPMGTVLIIK